MTTLTPRVYFMQSMGDSAMSESLDHIVEQALPSAGQEVSPCFGNIPAEVGGEIEKLQPAAQLDDAVAQFNLGVMYLQGEEVELDPARAARWIRQAADQNHIEAQRILGEMYDEG